MVPKKFTSFRLGVIGVIGIIGAIIFRWGVVNYAIRSQVIQKVRLEPGSDIWRIWTEMPVPMFSSFRFFNVTNPDDISRGAKPILQEVGPYVYEEKRHKIILEVNEVTVKYRPKVTYFFRPDLSYGSEDDNITLLNVPFVGVAKMAWEITKLPFVLSTLDDLLTEKGERLFHTNKVREYLFDGVSIENYMEILSLPVAQFAGKKFEIPKRLTDGDFGFFDDRNGTAEDIWIVRTGRDGLWNFGKIVSLNGMTKLDYWDDFKCDSIEGTDGTIFPPFVDKSRILKIYHPDACRTLQMEYNSGGEFMGLSTLKFTFAKSTFESLKLHPENKCFCKDNYEWCEKGGVLPIGACLGGAPLFLSKPHFSKSHADYRNAVVGLSEDGDYRSFIDIEPNIGLPIKGSIKMQLNVELQSYGEMTSFMDAPNLMFPVLWLEQTAHLTEKIINPIRKLGMVLQVANIIAGICIACSIMSIIGAVLWEGISSNWFGKIFGIKFN